MYFSNKFRIVLYVWDESRKVSLNNFQIWYIYTIVAFATGVKHGGFFVRNSADQMRRHADKYLPKVYKFPLYHNALETNL